MRRGHGNLLIVPSLTDADRVIHSYSYETNLENTGDSHVASSCRVTAVRPVRGAGLARPVEHALSTCITGTPAPCAPLPLAKQLTSAALCASPSRSLSSLSGRCAARGQRIGRRSGGSRCAESTSPHTHTHTPRTSPCRPNRPLRTVRSRGVPCVSRVLVDTLSGRRIYNISPDGIQYLSRRLLHVV